MLIFDHDQFDFRHVSSTQQALRIYAHRLRHAILDPELLSQRVAQTHVYRAFDLKLDQTVALKFLPPAANNNSRLLERFRGEVRVARQVSHRNVCRVHDIGDADGLAFISMEYIDGDNLATLLDYLEAGQPLSEFLEDFPTVTRKQAVSALQRAKEALLARTCPQGH